MQKERKQIKRIRDSAVSKKIYDNFEKLDNSQTKLEHKL